MNKFYIALLCLLTSPLLLHSQTTTLHKRFSPSFAYYAVACKLIPEGDHFLINTDRAVYQLNQLGEITHVLQLASQALNPHSGIKKYAAGTGHPYFVITKRDSPLSKDFKLAAYQPGQGIVNEMNFVDSIGLGVFSRPHLVDMGNDEYLVFGRKYYRKVSYNPTSGFSEAWARPLTVAPIAVVPYNNGFILADEKGKLQALDADGNEIWLHNHAVEFRALKLLSDGFLACGKTSSNQAAVIKLNFDGTEAWSKTYSGLVFNDIIQTSDGGFVAVGLGATNKMEMVKADPSGAVSWSQDYGAGGANNGGGAAVLELPGSGYLFLGLDKTGLHFIRTDPSGNAPDEERALVNSRFLKNSGLQSDFMPGPSLFFDGYGSTFLSFEDSIASTLFAFTPWIGGLGPDLSILLAAGDFHPGANADYRTGGAATKTNDFDRVWAANRTEIRNLREDYRLDKNLDNPVPFDLLSWPGKGNPNWQYNFDFSPVATDPALFPAPFVDANGDGLYNVYDGDYPAIKGDQMAWWLFTDSTQHLRTHGTPLVVDIQVEAYLFDCVQNPLVEQSLFVDYTLVNRSGSDYTGVYLGFFGDPDLGCHLDDYVGTAPQADAWYVYNSDDFDADCVGAKGFGSNIPVQSVGFLNRSLDQSMYYANGAVGNPHPATSDPDLPIEYYRYLQGLWRDGRPLTLGGNGYNLNSSDVTKYFFPANPPDAQGWSMCTENLPYADRRVVGSHGPFDFAANDTFLMQVAFTRHSNIPHPCPDIFGLIVPPLQQLKQWNADASLDLNTDLAPVYTIGSGQTITLDASVPGAAYAWSTGSNTPSVTVAAPGNYTVTITGETGCTQVQNMLVQTGVGTDEPQNLVQWKLWPNPTSGSLYIDCPDCGSGPLTAVLYNAQGQTVQQAAGLLASEKLTLKNLPVGLYWLELRSDSGSFGVQRVVVQR